MPSERQLRKLLKVYSKALRRHPNNLDLRTKLAEVLRLLDRMDEAIALYSSAAWAHGIAGNLGQAITLCKIILQLSPQHSETQEMLAKLYASQRIRQAKQSVPVVQVGGRWVADPRGGAPPGAAQSTSPPTTADREDDAPFGQRPPVVLSAPPLPDDDEDDYDDEDDGEEPTKNESPSNPDLIARRVADRHSRPTSKELPAARRVPPPPARPPAYADTPVPAQPDEQSLGSSGKVRSPFAVAPTMLKDDPVVVTTDEDGQMVVSKDPAQQAQGEHPTLQLPPTQVEKVAQEVPAPVPSLSSEVNIEEPTQLDSAPGEDEPAESAAQAAGEKRPTLEQPESRSVGARSVEHAIKQATPGPPAAAAVPAGERLSTGELSGVEASRDTDRDPATQVEPPAPRPDAQDAAATGSPSPALSPRQMMEQMYETMPKAHSGEFRREDLKGKPDTPENSGPPSPAEVSLNGDGDEVRIVPRTADQDNDPLRFIRTTRRYAAVEAELVEEEGTRVDPIDPGIVSAVVRMQEDGKEQRQSDTKGYAAIQKEVRQAGNQQEDQEPDAQEAEETERSLLDTIRDLPVEADGLAGEVNLPKVPFPLFSDLDTPAFLAMVEKLERRVCASGSLLFQEGDPGDSLYLVSTGNLEVLKQDDKGRLIVLARLGPGSFFGEFGLLTDRHRHASVRAVDECELLELKRDVLVELVKEHPSISWTLRIFYQQRLMAMVLATSPLFQAVGAEDRRQVLSRFNIKRIMEGETIIEEGKPGTGFYVILVGEVAVSCTAEDGAQIPLGLLSEGDYFGEISLLTGTPAEASVKANTITEVLMLNAGDFYDMASAHPEIWAEVQEEAERRQKENFERLADQARRFDTSRPLCLI